MDNSILLLIIIKKCLNVQLFVDWYRIFTDIHEHVPTYADYDSFQTLSIRRADVRSIEGELWCKRDYLQLSYDVLTDFEFNYVVTSLSLLGVI